MLWVLVAAVPAVYVALARPTTPHKYMPIALREHGQLVTQRFWFPQIHPGIMTPIAIATIATLAGMFIILDARATDRRLVLAGFRAGTLLATRLTEITLAAALATAASVAIAAALFHPRQWAVYAAANILTALTYALIGVILGPLFGRVAGVFIAFLIPFLDLAIAQDPMLYTQPPAWVHFLPGYGPMQVLLNGALAGTFDETRSLLIALAWLAGLLFAAALVFRRTMRTARTPATQRPLGGDLPTAAQPATRR